MNGSEQKINSQALSQQRFIGKKVAFEGSRSESTLKQEGDNMLPPCLSTCNGVVWFFWVHGVERLVLFLSWDSATWSRSACAVRYTEINFTQHQPQPFFYLFIFIKKVPTNKYPHKSLWLLLYHRPPEEISCGLYIFIYIFFPSLLYLRKCERNQNFSWRRSLSCKKTKQNQTGSCC